MNYLVTMAMLLTNAKDDALSQERIDRQRKKYPNKPLVQIHLDRKQAALDEARQRNYECIAEIARLN
jgi:hypothetical protein